MHSSDLLTTEDVMRDYRFPTRGAARMFIRRWGIPYYQRGRVLLVERRDFDEALERCRHRRQPTPPQTWAATKTISEVQ